MQNPLRSLIIRILHQPDPREEEDPAKDQRNDRQPRAIGPAMSKSNRGNDQPGDPQNRQYNT